MAEILNLRRARKEKARADDGKRAAENRAAHGRTKAEKRLAKAEAERVARVIEGHRREPDSER